MGLAESETDIKTKRARHKRDRGHKYREIERYR